MKTAMKYRAVIFDLDGVLCHTDRYHYQAWKTIADALDIPFDEESNNRLRGISRMDSLERILEGYPGRPLTLEEKEKLAAEKNALYRAQLETMTPADLPGEPDELLKGLRAGGIATAVASSSRNAPLILKRLGIASRFDVVVDGNQIGRVKPDPEVFLLAAERLHRIPPDCLVVEDARAGIAAAVAGGFDSAGIGDAAAVPGVTYALRSLGELSAVLGL